MPYHSSPQITMVTPDVVAATLAGGAPPRGADELPVPTVRRDAADDAHPVRGTRGRQTDGAHDVLASGEPTHRLTGQ